MINPQELRIGNIVKEKGFGTQEITELSEHGYNGFNSYNERVTFYYSDIEGIPLTEEWLLKFGFEKDEDGCLCHEYPDSNCKFYFVKDFIQVAKGYAAIFNYKHIKYIHQLQNLYWCLTGKELETI